MRRKSTVGFGGCLLLAIGVTSMAQDKAAAPGRVEPLVSIMELMQQTITPSTNQLWRAWEEPSTADEWKQMEDAAITLLAASSLTAVGGTGAKDNEWAHQPAWQAFNDAMIVAGRAALKASRERDQDALLAAGDALLAPCEGCHQLFNPGVVGQ